MKIKFDPFKAGEPPTVHVFDNNGNDITKDLRAYAVNISYDGHSNQLPRAILSCYVDEVEADIEDVKIERTKESNTLNKPPIINLLANAFSELEAVLIKYETQVQFEKTDSGYTVKASMPYGFVRITDDKVRDGALRALEDNYYHVEYICPDLFNGLITGDEVGWYAIQRMVLETDALAKELGENK